MTMETRTQNNEINKWKMLYLMDKYGQVNNVDNNSIDKYYEHKQAEK